MVSFRHRNIRSGEPVRVTLVYRISCSGRACITAVALEYRCDDNVEYLVFFVVATESKKVLNEIKEVLNAVATTKSVAR